MNVTRRQFLKVTAAGLGSSSLALLGFSPQPALADIRNFKLAQTTETRSTCPYCSVSCGVLLYSLGDKSRNVKSTIIHVEGDPDNPVNRGQQFRTSSTGCGGVGGGQGTGHTPPRPPRGADTVPDVWSGLRCFSGRCWV